jgi:hypothetical protein
LWGVVNNTDVYFIMIDGCPETGFLREYFVIGEEMGKNPVSKDGASAQKPGFCENIS